MSRFGPNGKFLRVRVTSGHGNKADEICSGRVLLLMTPKQTCRVYDCGSLVSVLLRLDGDLREATISHPAARRSARCCAANSSIVNTVLIQRMLMEPWTRLPSARGIAITANPSSWGGVP